MKSLDDIRVAFQVSFGPEAVVQWALTSGVYVYVFVIPVRLALSRVDTRKNAPTVRFSCGKTAVRRPKTFFMCSGTETLSTREPFICEDTDNYARDRKKSPPVHEKIAPVRVVVASESRAGALTRSTHALARKNRRRYAENEHQVRLFLHLRGNAERKSRVWAVVF